MNIKASKIMNKVTSSTNSKTNTNIKTSKIMKEVFKSIPNYEGIYEVSNLGRVKSFYMNKETILKSPIDKAGYHLLRLSKGGVAKTYKVHQLVAMAFLGHTPCGYKAVVNHIDFDKLNNNANNLEIVTSRQNSNQRHIKSSSKYTGVVWVKNNQKWKSQIRINGEVISLGHFDDELLASDAYQVALINSDLFDGDKKLFRTGVKETLLAMIN